MGTHRARAGLILALIIVAALPYVASERAAAAARATVLSAEETLPASFTEFWDEEMTFRLLMPTDWEFVPEQSEPGMWMFWGQDDCDMAAVEAYELPEGFEDSMTLASALLDGYSENMSGLQRVAGPVPLTLGGASGALFVYSFVSTRGVALKSAEAVICRDGMGYSLTIQDAPEEFDERAAMYETMLTSFVVSPQTSGLLRSMGAVPTVPAIDPAAGAPRPDEGLRP
ncbi:MAG: hypothetical protein VB144_10730 [Clostridia bacterium]|nr:hypothetical protein [Clostridia bacterium]